jgi:hypothetical protein
VSTTFAVQLNLAFRKDEAEANVREKRGNFSVFISKKSDRVPQAGKIRFLTGLRIAIGLHETKRQAGHFGNLHTFINITTHNGGCGIT